MKIDDKRIEQMLNKFESTLDSIRSIDLWLPQAIDRAIKGHHGTLDAVELDRMRKDRKEEEKIEAEVDSLSIQVEEAQKQTSELKKQTRYLLWVFIVTLLVNLLDVIFKISPDLFGLTEYLKTFFHSVSSG